MFGCNLLHFFTFSQHSQPHQTPNTMSSSMFANMFKSAMAVPIYMGVFEFQKAAVCKTHLKHTTHVDASRTKPWRSPWMDQQDNLKSFIKDSVESRKINFLTGVPGNGKTTHTRYIANNMYKDGEVSGVFYMYPNLNRSNTSLVREVRNRVCPQHDMPLKYSLSSTKESEKPLLVIIDEMDFIAWQDDRMIDRIDGDLEEFFTEMGDAVDSSNVSVIVVSKSESLMDRVKSKVRPHVSGRRYKMEHTLEDVNAFIDMFPESKTLTKEQRNELADVASKGGAIELVKRFFESISFGRSFEESMNTIYHLSGIWLEMAK